MKRSTMRCTVFAGLTVLGCIAALAEEAEFTTSANATLATDYVFRGQSQTLEEEAVQAGFDLGYGGFYAGAWGSNVDFGSAATAEIDYYLGYVFDLSDDLSLDLGYIYYSYAGEDDLDFSEGKLAVSWKAASVGLNYSPEYLGDGGEKYFYYFADYSFSLPNDFSLGLHVGLNQGDDQDIAFEGGSGEDTYTEWSVGVSRTFSNVDFGLTYWDTTIDDDKNELGEGRLVFSISASF